jgi:general secretion pathway protein C
MALHQHTLRRVAVVALVLGVATCPVALIVRGVLDLRASVARSNTEAAGPVRARSTPAEESDAPLDVGEEVLSRNIFDSRTGPLAWELEHAPEDGGASTEAEGDAGAARVGGLCSGDLRLLGSVVHGRDPRRSIAVLRKDGKTSLMTVGERLSELEFVALHPTEAYFRRGDSELCSLPVYLGADAGAPPPAPEPAAPVAAVDAGKPAPNNPKRPPAFSEEELSQNIRVLGPARFAVTRELFTRARMNPSGVTRGARFKPQTTNNRAVGMQVFKLRDDSLLAHLGVKQGDILRALNGHSLTSADGVLEAFGHLGKSPRISLAIDRGGARTIIEYVLE